MPSLCPCNLATLSSPPKLARSDHAQVCAAIDNIRHCFCRLPIAYCVLWMASSGSVKARIGAAMCRCPLSISMACDSVRWYGMIDGVYYARGTAWHLSCERIRRLLPPRRPEKKQHVVSKHGKQNGVTGADSQHAARQR